MEINIKLYDKIVSNLTLLNTYDKYVTLVIDSYLDIVELEKQEKYEKCQILLNKINKERSVLAYDIAVILSEKLSDVMKLLETLDKITYETIKDYE